MASRRIRRGEILEIAGKLYGCCMTCGAIVRLDKPIFGALHLCDAPHLHEEDKT